MHLSALTLSPHYISNADGAEWFSRHDGTTKIDALQQPAMNDVFGFWLNPTAVTRNWIAHPRSAAQAAIIAGELVAVWAAVGGLLAVVADVPFEFTLRLAGVAVFAVASMALLRRIGFPWIIRPIPPNPTTISPPPATNTTPNTPEASPDDKAPIPDAPTAPAPVVPTAEQMAAVRARVTTAAGTALAVTVVPAAMAVFLGAGIIGAMLVVAALGMLVALIALMHHGLVAEAAQTVSPSRFWAGIAAESVGNVVLVAGVVWLVGGSVAAVFRVPSQSMWPTLVPGDVMLVDPLRYAFGRAPERFDIVVLDHPGYDTRLVKRVVALGGERLEFAGGNLWIDGTVVVRPHSVQHSQLHREPIFAFNAQADYHQFLAEIDRATDAHGQPIGAEEKARRQQAWPAEAAKRIAGQFDLWVRLPRQSLPPDWQQPQTRPADDDTEDAESDAFDPNTFDPQQWQHERRPADAAADGVVVVEDESDPASVLVRQVAVGPDAVLRVGPDRWLQTNASPVDPAMLDSYSPSISDDLALQIRAQFDHPPTGPPNGVAESAVGVTIAVRSGATVAEHRFRLRVTATGTADVDGDVVLESPGQPTVGQRAELPALRHRHDPRAPFLLRVQNIDGLWDAWLGGRHIRHAELAAPVALKGRIDGVTVRIDATAAVTIHNLTLTTPTHYFAYGPLAMAGGVVVPHGHAVVLGDFSRNSEDSREFEALEVTWPDGHQTWRMRNDPDDVVDALDPARGRPRRRLAAVPFVAYEWLVGRAEAVVAPAGRERPLR